MPRWLEGSQVACSLLDATAAHRNYVKMENVQNDSIKSGENSTPDFSFSFLSYPDL